MNTPTLPGPDRFRLLLELVEESLNEPELTADDLADLAYLSPARWEASRSTTTACRRPQG